MSDNIQDAISAFKQRDIAQPQMENKESEELTVGYEIIPLPSKGDYYKSKKDSLKVQYLTTKDEDILTTPSLIENNTVLDVIMKRKILDKDFDFNELIGGDKEAILLFLRKSAYGSDYKVEVSDPRNGIVFPATVDLNKIKYKEISEKPDSNGHFSVYLDVRKKDVKFRLLTDNEEKFVRQNSEAIQKAYGTEYSSFLSQKLKAQIISINGNTDKSYIDKFVDAMPPLDGRKLRRKILDVTPGLDMKYDFTTKDGYTFNALLSVGIDFFFPSL